VEAQASSTWLDTLEAIDRKAFVSSFVSQNIRPDGRTFTQSRPVSIAKGILSKHTAGSALVKFGSTTQVLAGVTLQIGHPAADSSSCGDVSITVNNSNGHVSLQRWLQRIVAMTVPMEQLCIEPGHAAWRLVVSCQILKSTSEHDVQDACLLAIMAALLETQLPKTQKRKDGTMDIVAGSTTTFLVLPVISIPISFGVIVCNDSEGPTCILDPTTQEDPIVLGRLSMVIVNNDVANVRWSGHVGLSQTNIAMAAQVAIRRAKELTKILANAT